MPWDAPSDRTAIAAMDAGADVSGAGDDGVSEEARAWLDEFRRRHGRGLRVLHVGNIANNAFLNAKFLRRVGVEADVLCYEYYHALAAPEWEEADFEGDHGDDFGPRWHALDLHGYRRPAWFVQGPPRACRLYLEARHGSDEAGAERRWRSLARYQRLRSHPRLYELARLAWVLLRRTLHRLRRAVEPAEGSTDDDATAERLVRLFDRRFPDRADRLVPGDLKPWMESRGFWQSVFRHYDLVQCYSTDPVHALVAGVPYVAFEHGTLRTFTLGDHPLHRLTSLAYREAEHAFITNGDCLEYARAIGLERFSPMIHPVDVEQHERESDAETAALRSRYGADALLLCTLRHDWEVKGTDVHLRALPLIRERFAGKVVLVLTEWGEQVRDSRRLIEDLGCADAVHWRAPLPRVPLIRHFHAADVVLDQMALPHFGATAPQAMASGTPVVMSYRPESTEWIVPEPAPILPAFSPEEVADAVVRALEPGFREDYRRRARAWVHRYHHPRRIVRDHLSVYRRILESTSARGQAG